MSASSVSGIQQLVEEYSNGCTLPVDIKKNIGECWDNGGRVEK